MTNRSSVRPTDHPSNQESVRPTVLLRRKANIVLSATTSTLFIATTKVAAVGRHHKRGGAAFGRATSFVVSFVLALNRVNVVAVTTILVLHVGVIGHHVSRQSCFMFPRRTITARLRARGVQGALPPGRGVWGGLRPPQGSRGVWGAARPPNGRRI